MTGAHQPIEAAWQARREGRHADAERLALEARRLYRAAEVDIGSEA